MKVTFIISQLSPVLGMERSALNLIERLRNHSLDIRVICIGGKAADREIFSETTILGPPIKGSSRLLAFTRLHRYAKSVCEDEIVVLVGAWTALPWLLVNGHKPIRSVVWEHTLLREKNAFSRKVRLLNAAAKRLYSRASAVIAVSEPVAQDIRRFPNVKRVETIPNCVDTASDGEIMRSFALHSNNKTTLLSVGSLSKIKAQSVLLRSLAYLPDDFRVRLVGTGPNEKHLRRLTSRLGLSSRVEFCGFLDPTEVRKEMQSATILMHTSIAETFGLVYTEAANHGLPVISVRTRTSEWMIPKYAPGRTTTSCPKELAEAVQTFSLPNRDDYLIAAANRRRNFGSSAVASRWIDVFSSIMLMRDSK